LQIFYDDLEEAQEDVRRGKISGVLYFSANFTSSLTTFSDDESVDDSGKIQVYLDQSDYAITNFLQGKLQQTYHEFSESLMADCGKARKAGNLPMHFEAFYGKMNDEFKKSITPGISIT